MNNSFRTIFFDVGNTLLFPNRERILAPLQALNVVPSDEHWKDLEARTKNDFDDMLEHNGRADHSFWYMFYTRLMKELGAHDDAVRDQLVEATRTSSNWDVIRPGTCETLLEIGRGHKMGVISNADGKI